LDIEAEMLIWILEMTKKGSVLRDLLKKGSRLPRQYSEKLIKTLQKDGLLYVRKGTVELNTLQRVSLAIRAVQMGADVERVTSFLHWKEFEEIAGVAFERNGYDVRRTLRFKHSGRRWEIDVVGFKKPLVVCVDCKHWKRGLHPSTLKRIVAEQVRRTSALAESLPDPSVRIAYASWNRTKFIPVILSLTVSRFKFYDNVPIVPVLQVQDFLQQLPALAYSVELHSIEKTSDSTGLANFLDNFEQ
jgi:Holliday junction resolvase-like predicted endonuclease